MNCRSAESLLLAERDGVLTSAQHAELASHLAACGECRQMQALLATAMDGVRHDAQSVRVPDVEAEWAAVQARLNGAALAQRTERRRLAPVIWFGAPLAAAAALALAFFVTRPVPTTPNFASGSAEIAAHADYVEVADPNASPIVYTDKESGWLVVWAENTNAVSG
jgi:anti-sigma factor RsiW